MSDSDVGQAENPSMPVRLTPIACEMVKKALAEEGSAELGLRVAVAGGGCAGLQYVLDFSDAKRLGDTVFSVDGLAVYVDMASAVYLQGTEIDYVSGANGDGFKFNNPNPMQRCACGHAS